VLKGDRKIASRYDFMKAAVSKNRIVDKAEGLLY